MAVVSGGRVASAQRTRQNVIDAAQGVFARRGVVPVSLRDVAAAAGISHPGLLRHFASKAPLVDAVIAQLDDEVGLALDAVNPGELTLSAVARVTAGVTSFDLLASMLATADGLEDARARLDRRFLDIQERLERADRMAPRQSLDEELVVWTGLRLLAQYLPGEIDAADQLDRADAGQLRRGLEAEEESRPVITLADIVDREEGGYAKGKERRRQILSDATTRFARSGYHGTSLREIAESAGVSQSSLLYHFESKEQLLTAVLRRRDEMLAERGRADADPAAELASVGDDARLDAGNEPGLIELHARVASEAAAIEHPAHDYLARRYRRTIDYFSHLIDVVQKNGAPDGALISPRRGAIRFIGLWEGLQLQALDEGDFTHIGSHLEAFLHQLLTGSSAATHRTPLA